MLGAVFSIILSSPIPRLQLALLDSQLLRARAAAREPPSRARRAATANPHPEAHQHVERRCRQEKPDWQSRGGVEQQVEYDASQEEDESEYQGDTEPAGTRLKLPIQATYDLEDAPAALAELVNHTSGKLAIRVA